MNRERRDYLEACARAGNVHVTALELLELLKLLRGPLDPKLLERTLGWLSRSGVRWRPSNQESLAVLLSEVAEEARREEREAICSGLTIEHPGSIGIRDVVKRLRARGEK